MKRWVGALAVIASNGMFATGALGLQERAAVQAVRVSPDTVELGDPFTLRASVYIPPGRELRVPATLLPEWGVESLRPVRTEVVEAVDGSLQVVLEYDLIPFEIGLAATPQLEMTSGEAEAGAERVRVEDGPEGSGDPADGGDAPITQITQNTQNTQIETRTGQSAGADAERRPEDTGNADTEVNPATSDESADPDEPSVIPEASGADERPRDRLVVAGRRVFVASPILLDDIAQGLQPSPPADVVGSSWHVPAVLGASLLSLLLLGVGTVQAREWLAARAAAVVRVEAPPETPEMWRERALGELDRLLARGHHRAGRLRDFYEGAGDVVREYVAHFDPAWSRSRTSTELMRDLSAGAGWPDAEALARAMGRGEVAKFAASAGAREDAAATAEGDWGTMRAWVDASAEAPAFAKMRDEIVGERLRDGAATESGPGLDGESASPRGGVGGAGAVGVQADRVGPAGIEGGIGGAGVTGGRE